jgi:hypothetical protein
MSIRRGRYFAWGTKKELPAVTLDDKQFADLVCGDHNIGVWIGDRMLVLDYMGKLKFCKSHAKKNMRKVVK